MIFSDGLGRGLSSPVPGSVIGRCGGSAGNGWWSVFGKPKARKRSKPGTTVEQAILARVLEVLAGKDLRSVGLQAVLRDIHRTGSDTEYQSEVAVDFFEDSNLVDIIEFWIYRQGQLDAGEDKLIDWFVRQVDDVIRRRQPS